VKASKFNIFSDTDDGNILAFNSVTCALVKIDRNTYQKYLTSTDGLSEMDEKTDPTISAFIKGGFLIPDRMDEIDIIKIKEAKGRYSVTNSLGLTIAVTTACNFNCEYCFENGIKPEFMSRDVEEKIIRFVDNFLQPNGSLGITWYGGEPLLALDTICRLSDAFERIVSEKQLTYTAGIITNGYLLDCKTASELAKRKVSIAQITLDGSQEQHDSRRMLKNGGGTFHKIMDNIAQIVDIIPVNVRCNLDKSNIDAFPKLLDEFDRYGLSHKVNIGPFALEAFDFSSGEIKDKAIPIKDFTNFYYESVNMMLDRGIHVSLLPSPKKIFCVAATEYTFVVDPLGRLYKCWDLIGREDEIIGTVDKGIKLEDGSAKWLTWDYLKYEECLNCNILPICLGGCPRLKLVKDAQMNSRDRCPTYKFDMPGFIKLLYRQKDAGKRMVVK